MSESTTTFEPEKRGQKRSAEGEDQEDPHQENISQHDSSINQDDDSNNGTTSNGSESDSKRAKSEAKSSPQKDHAGWIETGGFKIKGPKQQADHIIFTEDQLSKLPFSVRAKVDECLETGKIREGDFDDVIMEKLTTLTEEAGLAAMTKFIDAHKIQSIRSKTRFMHGILRRVMTVFDSEEHQNIVDELPLVIQEKLQGIYDANIIAKTDLEPKVLRDNLEDLKVEGVIECLTRFAKIPLGAVRSKTAFLVGIMKKYRVEVGLPQKVYPNSKNPHGQSQQPQTPYQASQLATQPPLVASTGGLLSAPGGPQHSDGLLSASNNTSVYQGYQMAAQQQKAQQAQLQLQQQHQQQAQHTPNPQQSWAAHKAAAATGYTDTSAQSHYGQPQADRSAHHQQQLQQQQQYQYSAYGTAAQRTQAASTPYGTAAQYSQYQQYGGGYQQQ